MNSFELLSYLQKVIDSNRGHKPIIIITPCGQELEIKEALFLSTGIDTYQDSSENLELTTTFR